MLTQTLDRVRPVVPAKNIFVITSAQQEKGVRAVCTKIPKENIIAEPVGRDTAAAVALASALVAARDPNGVFAVLPADHVIHDAEAYQRDLPRRVCCGERRRGDGHPSASSPPNLAIRLRLHPAGGKVEELPIVRSDV